MQGQEKHMNRIGMHVQNRAFANQDFCQPGCLVHMNWKNTGMEKHGQIKVKPRQNEKNKNIIMPVMQLVMFFMHINLKRTSK